MVVAGVIESRGGLFIKKRNNDTELSNSVNNRAVRVDEDFTSLDLTTTVGKVNFKSHNKASDLENLPTSFLFSADGNMTKVGINIPAGQDPSAALHVAGVNDKFIVGRGNVV